MRNIKFLLTVIVLADSIVNAAPMSGYNFAGNVKQVSLADDGWVYFSLLGQSPGTCTKGGDTFKFDGNTTSGMLKYSMLVKARASNLPVNVWYVLGSQQSGDGSDDSNTAVANTITLR